MEETLAGRLKLENTGMGIQVEIPARLDWTVLFLLVWLALWSFGGWQVINSFSTKGSHFLVVWIMGWFAGEVFAITSIIWSLGGRTTLLLDSSRLDITRRVFGIQWDVRSFDPTEIRNFRYQPATRYGRSSSPSQIRFEAGDKTCKFASGLADAEAFALIDKMLVIFPFPKDRALDYIANR